MSVWFAAVITEVFLRVLKLSEYGRSYDRLEVELFSCFAVAFPVCGDSVFVSSQRLTVYAFNFVPVVFHFFPR